MRQTITRTHRLVFISAVTIALSTGQVYAGNSDLISLYQKAVDYDTEIAAAKEAFLAEQQGEDIARAGLLPSVNASASTGHTNLNSLPNNDYQTTAYSVTLTQPLFNLPNWHNLSSSELNTLRAKSIYLAAQQDLILQVASAYFDVLRAKENLKTAQSQEAAVKRQYEQAREQFDVGLIAITDVHEARAGYDASQTNRIRGEGILTVAIENLSRITGQYTSELFTLRADLPVKLDQAVSAEQWEQAAGEHNLAIKTAEYALKSLEKQLQATKAGHLPTVNLSASYGNTDLNSFVPSGRDAEETSLSLNLNLPLYSGGATQASVRQVSNRVEQARQQLTSAQRQARIQARTEYINTKTNIQTIESLKQNIVSRESALEATREGYNVGTRNIVEVLDAERNYFSALGDYANARFDFVESNLRIRQAAGTLNEGDLKELNVWLEPEKRQ